MKNTYSKFFLTATLVIILSTVSFCKAIAQTPGKIAVTATEKKTNIWVSNFPKNTSVVVVDADNNLLSIVSTNDLGATFISFDKAIQTAIIVKTMNGETMASYKTIKNEQNAEVAAINTAASDVKA